MGSNLTPKRSHGVNFDPKQVLGPYGRTYEVTRRLGDSKSLRNEVLYGTFGGVRGVSRATLRRRVPANSLFHSKSLGGEFSSQEISVREGGCLRRLLLVGLGEDLLEFVDDRVVSCLCRFVCLLRGDACLLGRAKSVQEYLTYEKTQPPRTLWWF